MSTRKIVRWGAKWQQMSPDGLQEYLLCEELMPVMFRTRADSRAYITKRYGEIKHRQDLREAPHFWLLPVPVRIVIQEQICEL